MWPDQAAYSQRRQVPPRASQTRRRRGSVLKEATGRGVILHRRRREIDLKLTATAVLRLWQRRGPAATELARHNVR